MTSTQIRTHAHTHAARRDSRTDIRTPACSAFGNHRGTWPTSRSARALRALRVLRARYASESRGALTGEARLAGSDGAPLGGSERGRACNVTPAATPPSASRTEAQEVANRARMAQDGPSNAGGGTDGGASRSERAARPPPVSLCPISVFVPYLKNRFPRGTLSRDSAQQVVSPSQATWHGFSAAPSPVVAGTLVAESSFLYPPEGAGCSTKRWKDGGRGECEKDAIRPDAAVRTLTCHTPQPSCILFVNSESSELPQLLTVSQVSQRISICRRTVERFIATQQLHACKIGRATRIAVA